MSKTVPGETSALRAARSRGAAPADKVRGGSSESMASQDSIETSGSDVPASAPNEGGPRDGWGLEPGSRFPSDARPEFIIKGQIDDGGMGIVYEAHQERLGVVAIKVIKPRILTPAACERFLKEAEAMGRVRGEPGIATIFTWGTYTDPAAGFAAPYIVMEYIAGAKPITAHAEERKLGTRARLELFARVCAALGAAHREGIIHRDLKPENVMVDTQGDPKVIDFGLALARSSSEDPSKVPSERGGLFGTLDYMSPEQAARNFDPHSLTPASDVHSLGVILYKLLTGRLPYARQPGLSVVRSEHGHVDYTEATRIIREDAPIPPRRLKPSLHPGVEAILLRALEKSPRKRYRDAGELGAALSRHLKLSRWTDLARGVVVAFFAAWIVPMIAFPVLFGWTPVNRWFQAAVAKAVPAVSTFKHVVVVAADEKTDLSAFESARQAPAGTYGFGPGERARPLWGEVLDALAVSGCGTVAIDMYVGAPALHTEDDERLMRGLRDLQDHHVDWVWGAAEWDDKLHDLPPVVTFGDRPRGAIWIRPAEHEWRIDAALERDNRTMVALPFLAAAQQVHRNAALLFDLASDGTGVQIRYSEDGSTTWRNKYETFEVERIVAGDSPEAAGVSPGSNDVYGHSARVALYYLPRFPPDDQFARCTIDAGELLRMSTSERISRLQGRVVVLANRHAGFAEEEWAATPDGRVIPKSYGHALAAETLLSGTPAISSLMRRGELVAVVVTGLVGALVGVMLPGRLLRALAVGGTLVCILFAGSLVMVRYGSYICNPIVPSAALMAALLMTEGATLGSAILRRFVPAVMP